MAETTDAVLARTKTETRRLGWTWLPPGVDLDLCRKVQGRRRRDGTVEPLERLARVHVTSVHREPLRAITHEAVAREGVPEEELLRDWSSLDNGPADRFVRFYCRTFGVDPDTMVTVIRWRYLPTPDDWPT